MLEHMKWRNGMEWNGSEVVSVPSGVQETEYWEEEKFQHVLSLRKSGNF